ncbi:MAG: hypothetical protein LBQ07_00630 [Endomicrobium sp.]|jgi:acetyl-CoA carboxylase biotin carboxyl carrier protein|nr:hypothetical protein [Endomicrobium sp.]
MIDIQKDKVKTLYEVMKDDEIQELEVVNSGEYSIYIKRKCNKNADDSDLYNRQHLKAQEKLDKKKITTETIKSPIAGIFYASSTLSYHISTKEGDIVEVGKTLCIIEAMKAMNEIKATSKVMILKILSKSGEFVTEGQDLFEVEKL